MKGQTHHGKQCPTCGLTERYTSSGRCATCQRQRQAGISIEQRRANRAEVHHEINRDIEIPNHLLTEFLKRKLI